MAATLAGLSELGAIVGTDRVLSATPGDAIDGVQPRLIVEPGTPEEVAGVLQIAQDAGLRVAARGCGTKMDWGRPPRAIDIVLSTKRLNCVLEHAWADMTSTVEAGCTVARFQEALAQHRQRLALDPLWPADSTIGGILATNDSGALRIRFGALRDLIIGITVALPNGTLARSGGKVVKNVAGYDLSKLFTGSFGTLGVITQATFRLYPLAPGERSISFRGTTPSQLNRIALAIHDSNVVTTGLQLRAGAGQLPELDVRLEGTGAALDAQTDKLMRLAAGAEEMALQHDTWTARERLFEGPPGSTVCKFTTLPDHLSNICELIDKTSSTHGLTWRLVVQSIGVGLLGLEGPVEAVQKAIEVLRAELGQRDGSLVVLRCPPEMKSALDVWGWNGDALPLMRRVKEQFDPNGILNPGRFVGGI